MVISVPYEYSVLARWRVTCTFFCLRRVALIKSVRLENFNPYCFFMKLGTLLGLS